MVIYPADNGTCGTTYRDSNSTEDYTYIEHLDKCSVKALSSVERGQVALQDMLDKQRDKFNRHSRRKLK